MSDDITFCANRSCRDIKCERNMKNIRIHYISHSVAMFKECSKWKDSGARWLTKQIPKENDHV